MNLLQGIDPLLQLDVIRGSWVFGKRKLASFLRRQLDDELTLSSAWPSCSFTYCCVRAAKGVNEALRPPSAHDIAKADRSTVLLMLTFLTVGGTYEKFLPNA